MDIIWYMYMYLGELLQGVMVDGSFEYYFIGGKILCVYMYIGDYFYRWLFQGVRTLFDYIEYTHLEYFSGVLFLSFSIYCQTLMWVLSAGVLCTLGLQDESLQVTISRLPYGSLTCTGGDFPCTWDIRLTSQSEGQCTYLASSLQMTLEKACLE